MHSWLTQTSSSTFSFYALYITFIKELRKHLFRRLNYGTREKSCNIPFGFQDRNHRKRRNDTDRIDLYRGNKKLYRKE